MPRISVIVPVYNVENYLDRCVKSILKQTYTDFELILVDDGSKDKSGEICDIYAQKDSRIHVIHKENAGVSAARNTGIDAATGDYVMFVDSDDYIDSEMLQAMFIYAGSDIILSGLRYVDTNGDFIKEHFAEAFRDMPLAEYVDTYYVYHQDMRFVLAGPYNKLFSRKIFTEHNVRFNESISICEDGLFVAMYLTKCKTISNVDRTFYNYVQYASGSLMSRYNANAIEACELYHKGICDLLDCGNNITPAMREQIDEEHFALFTSFFFQIYIRSGFPTKGKYKKAKEAFQNKTFERLAKKTKKKSFKALLIKLTAITGWVFPLHTVCSLWFRKK